MEMTEHSEKSYGDKINVAIRKDNEREITIKFPTNTYKRFRTWADNNTSGCYWLAVDKLLNAYEQEQYVDNEFRSLMDRDDMIAHELKRVSDELELIKQVSAAPKVRRTFGRKDIVETKGE